MLLSCVWEAAGSVCQDTILTEILRGFTQSYQGNPGMVPKIIPQILSPCHFTVYDHLVLQCIVLSYWQLHFINSFIHLLVHHRSFKNTTWMWLLSQNNNTFAIMQESNMHIANKKHNRYII
jgi:hypothetical protein